MKKVEVVCAKEVKARPIDLRRFTMEYSGKKPLKNVTKKEIREMADALGLSYDDTHIAFAKKLMNAYMKKEIK